jgi:polar amino acid transport system substrate-binding protein
MIKRGSFRAQALAAALAAAATAFAVAPAAGAEPGRAPLRVCADPDNLPFTKSEGPQRGMYIDLAELVAAKLQVPIEYTWYYTTNQRRMMRNTVAKNECDAVFALPSDYRSRGLVRSKPFFSVGYAVVAAPGYSFATLDDLRQKRIAVLFNSTPHILLNTLEGFKTATFLSSAQAFAALAKGEVDVAMMWGPLASYENRTLQGARWQVTPVSGHDLAGQVSVGVRADQPELAKAIDAALAELAPQIIELADKYGFPRGKPVLLAQGQPLGPSRTVAVASELVVRVNAPRDDKSPQKPAVKPAAKSAAKPGAAAPAAAAAAAATAVAAPSGSPEALPSDHPGRVRFNDQCSHCHGQDGYSAVRERDLRRLKMRYDAKWEESALNTIRDGRVDAGMPTWKNILKEGEINELLAFLVTIQR